MVIVHSEHRRIHHLAGMPEYEFHISAKARKKYSFDESLFSTSGNIIFVNFHGARVFTQKMNTVNDILKNPDKAVRAGIVNAIGLIDEIFHYIFYLFKEKNGLNTFSRLVADLDKKLGHKTLNRFLLKFVYEFPPQQVYSGQVSAREYLNGSTGNATHREMLIEELLLLDTANRNPAYTPFANLFDNHALSKTSAYKKILTAAEYFFSQLPPFGPDSMSVLEMIREPAKVYPHSIPSQLKYIRERWGMLLGPFLIRLLGSLDLIQEEEKTRHGGPGESQILEFGENDYERFSTDREWMPNVVLIAKNVLVWMDQLSRTYGYKISTLNEIPDKEIKILSERGFNGLWLIGLWERSRASRKIKQYCGNPEAEASAYSLLDYSIADSLGGWPALENLRARCWRYRIRLASDMVPNHTGIDSNWVLNHPEYFIQCDYPPFPSYTFNGGNLSEHPGVGIYIEDHYYDRTDAAVVFKRVDFSTGQTRYMYHGNDGTHMPWNDTAQLNYLDPEVRETVIQTIIHVARNFPIIRFDAAMTLAKKHIQRLWFPEPGSGGDIPSRSGFGMPGSQFNEAIPGEFWREVVDRIASEVPDTLLLAEAFWMMEGFFVRTLGMHRVYNSAFMNMLKNEENGKYRQTIKNTLLFDPEILKRFVNFMNNPDEETAIAQFGNGDKYFGVCILMITMPGLPMFGHGQIEGFTEKYGMEYTRAYKDENPDTALIERHAKEIFPLCRMRHAFSGVKDFLLYNYFTAFDGINENVFAYTNRAHDKKALVLYNNNLSSTEGWIRESVEYFDKSGTGLKLAKNIAEGLALHNSRKFFIIFRELMSGLEYIRYSKEIWDQGLHSRLAGYQAQVFIVKSEIEDDNLGHYRELMNHLQGAGVPDMDTELKRILLKPIHDAFSKCLDLNIIRIFSSVFSSQTPPPKDFLPNLVRFYRFFIHEAAGTQQESEAVEHIIHDMMQTSSAIIELAIKNLKTDSQALGGYRGYLQRGLGMRPEAPAVLLSWTLLESLGLLMFEDYAGEGSTIMDQWFLADTVKTTLQQQGILEDKITETMNLLRILIIHQNWYKKDSATYLKELLGDVEIQSFIQVNTHNDIVWFSKDHFEDLLWWLFLIAAIRLIEEKGSAEDVEGIFSHIKMWLKAEQKSAFRFEVLLDEIT